MPARAEESHHAMDEGINFMNLHNPVEIIGENGWVKKVKVEKMELGEPDASGRRRPVVTGKYETVEFESVIVSIGQSPNPLIKHTNPDIKTESWGGIIIDDTTMTSKDGVFAGGDAVSGAATVILAMGAGKKAAANIDKYIRNKNDK